MKKTLIVTYTPRIDSNTRKLVDYFVDYNQDNTNIEILDLAETTPDLLLEENLNLFLKRNYAGIGLENEEVQVLEKNDYRSSIRFYWNSVRAYFRFRIATIS